MVILLRRVIWHSFFMQCFILFALADIIIIILANITYKMCPVAVVVAVCLNN